MSHRVAWICLVLVASTMAYGLQLTTAAIVPSAATADQLSSATLTRRVLIVVVDPITGDRANVECDAPANSFASDILIVDADNFPAVAQTCLHSIASGAPL
jgi:hypothetical protein